MNYNSIAKSYNELHKEEQYKKFSLIKQFLKPKKTDSLLDIGAGTGFVFDNFDCNITALEPSKEMIKQSKNKIIQGFAENLPFKNQSFDIIISVTAIHNFNDYKKSIKEIKRVLKPNGKLVITLLKKASKFNEIKKELLNNFKLNELEEDKDVIFYKV